MRYATIGTSMITGLFIEGARMVEGLELAAVYSRSKDKAEAFARKYGAGAVFTDLERMAESGAIDAVYVASPNALHFGQSRLFLEHGKHVLCEKPAVVTPAQLKELLALAERKNLIFMEAIKMLHIPARAILKEAVGRIGRVTTARIDYSQLSSKYQSYLEGKVPNIFNPKLAAGCLMDLGVYCVYPAIDLFGVPDSIRAAAGFLTTGADGYGNSIFSYPGRQVSLSYSKVGEDRVGSEIVGDQGTVVIGSISKLTEMKIVWNDGGEEKLAGSVPRPVLMSGEARDFCRWAQNPAGHREEYRYASALAVHVSEAMETIRRQAGIRFDL